MGHNMESIVFLVTYPRRQRRNEWLTISGFRRECDGAHQGTVIYMDQGYSNG